MIPTIEDIVSGLCSGQFTQKQAVQWLYDHADNSVLRDQYAGMAMEAMVNGSWPDSNERAEIANRSYLMADAMLEARK